MRRVVALLVAGALVLAGCGGDGGGGGEDPPRPAVVRQTIGQGAEAVTVLRPGAVARPPVVLFLHGWGGTQPRTYGPWLDHLVAEGNAVVFPRYQASVLDPPARALGNVLVGMRRALARVPTRAGSLVVVGHSAGGALAADYAAVAAAVGLPVPLAVMAAYPGRAFQGVPFGIPAVDPARIAPQTRLLVLAGTEDRVVGDATARAIVEGAAQIPAARRRLTYVTDPAVADHLGPQRAGRTSRAAFWAPLDALIATARRGAARP